MKKQNAFTLIELLVVIAVLGLIASIALVSMNSARAKARNVRRVADLKQMQKALDLYYSSNNGYPRYDGGGSVSCPDSWALNSSSYQPCWDDLQTRLSPYMVRLPTEAFGNGNYHYRGNVKSGQGYYLLMLPEGSVEGEELCYDGALGGWWCTGLNWQ